MGKRKVQILGGGGGVEGGGGGVEGGGGGGGGGGRVWVGARGSKCGVVGAELVCGRVIGGSARWGTVQVVATGVVGGWQRAQDGMAVPGGA